MPDCQRLVVLLYIICYHPVCSEITGYFGYGILNNINPLSRDTCLFIIVVKYRRNFVLPHIINCGSIKLILLVLIFVGLLHWECPARSLFMTFNPPSVKYWKVHYTIHNCLFSA